MALVPRLNVNFTPTYVKPAITISYNLPNSSPDIVERLATSALENALSEIEGVNKVYSISRYNKGTITMDFDKGQDMAFRKFEVSSIVRNIYKKLPKNMSYPRIELRGGETQNVEESPILVYSVNGPYAPFKIAKDIDELIKKPLSQLSEIKEVVVRGANPLQITVEFDPAVILRYGLSKNEIVSAISMSSQTEYPGMITTGSGQRFFLKTNAVIPDVAILEQSRVAVVAGKSIFLKDLAKVFIEEQRPISYQRINGLNAVYVNVYTRENVNKIVVAEKVRQLIKNQSALSADLDIRLERDETEFLQEEMDKIYQRTGLSVLILVVFIFLINRNVRYLITLFLGIIVNLCITAIFIYALNVELHIFSIAGLIISFGLILPLLVFVFTNKLKSYLYHSPILFKILHIVG